MIIQNGTRLTQDATAAGRVSEDATRAVVAPGVDPRRRATVELPEVAAAPVATQQHSAEELQKAVDNINRVMRQSNRNLQFSVDSEANRVVVKLTDAETGELIRQIPSEETLAISRAIGEFQQGLLLRQEV